ncbi:MAG: AAA family ATPase [Gammaproteobacteria bacterium]|nr:AAA family ATPase [Gammaproteobacteria bacterium]
MTGAQHTTKVNLAGAYAAFQQNQQASDYLLCASVEYQSPDRLRQLDTLLHLSHFTDYLLLLTAPLGAGKSFFAEQFLNAQPADTCVVHLCPDQSIGAPDLLREVLSELPVEVPDQASMEQSVSLLRDLSVSLAEHDQVLLVVIDDAQWLANDALELLANVIPQSAPADACPHIVLFAEPELADRFEAPLFADLRQERYYQLTLASFSQPDSRVFLRQILDGLGLPGDAAVHDSQLDQLHKLATGRPGYLDMLLRQALRQGNLQDEKSGLPVWHMAAITLMVAALLTVWWFNQQSSEPAADSPVVTVVPNDATQSQLSTAPVIQQARQPLPVLAPLPLSPQPAYQSFQPEEVPPDNTTVPQVEDLVDLQQTEEINQLLKQSQVLQQQLQNVAATISASPLPATDMAVASVLPVKPELPWAALAPAERQFMSLPPNHYSLQVLGARYEATARQFVQRLSPITLPNYLLQLQRGGEPWFVVLVGDFVTQAEANQAIAGLPRRVRDLQPWPRSVVKLQQQLVNKINAGGE